MNRSFSILATIVLPLFALLSCSHEESVVPVKQVSISQPTAEMEIGETIQLSAEVSPSNATHKDITWHSSRPSVASVSETGLVAALAVGNATIYAKADGKMAECAIKVSKSSVVVSSISLNTSELSLLEGTSETLTATVKPDNVADKTVSWTTSDQHIATVDGGRVTAVKAGTATITASCGDKSASCAVTVKSPFPDAVDMGLPSGIKWASFNLGASAPYEIGDYYAWGETEPYYVSINPLVWKSGKEAGYGWESYIWCNGTRESLTKYNTATSMGSVDNEIILALSDDAANTILGGKWRIPTKEEWRELLQSDFCEGTWTTENGESGYKISSSKTGNSLFFPAGGVFTGIELVDDGNLTNYWPSTLCVDDPSQADRVCMSKDGNPVINTRVRRRGQLIRAVLDEMSFSIRISDTSLSMYIGRSTTLTASITLSSNPLSSNPNRTISWASTSPSVATVDQKGNVTAIKEGKTTIIAMAGNKIARCYITVLAKKVTNITLDREYVFLATGESEILYCDIEPYDATNTNVLWTSSNPDYVSVDQNGKVTAISSGSSSTITVAARDGSGKKASCEVVVCPCPGYTVDLGIGTIWASSNLIVASYAGCYNGLCANPEDYGAYFAWGQVDPRKYSEEGPGSVYPKYDLNHYIFHGSDGFTKYNTSSTTSGTPDNKTKLDPEDDAATWALGSKWRMPTPLEWNLLINLCEWTWTSRNGVNGYKVTGPNGNSIFLPAAGIRIGSSGKNDSGNYWSSYLYVEQAATARSVSFNSDEVLEGHELRMYGLSIRPVWAQ